MASFEKHWLTLAAAPYQKAGKFAWHFAKGKLSGDPVFKLILQQGLISPRANVLDIGCGQGLLSASLLAAESLANSGHWPGDWAAAPIGVSVKGIDLNAQEIARANLALSVYKTRMRFTQADIREAPLEKANIAVILDVLHYVTHPEQEAVLKRVKVALAPSGKLLLRVGNNQGGLGFKLSTWVDRAVAMARGQGISELYCRSLNEWRALLLQLGFKVRVLSVNQTAFTANTLLLAYLD